MSESNLVPFTLSEVRAALREAKSAGYSKPKCIVVSNRQFEILKHLDWVDRHAWYTAIHSIGFKGKDYLASDTVIEISEKYNPSSSDLGHIWHRFPEEMSMEDSGDCSTKPTGKSSIAIKLSGGGSLEGATSGSFNVHGKMISGEITRKNIRLFLGKVCKVYAEGYAQPYFKGLLGLRQESNVVAVSGESGVFPKGWVSLREISKIETCTDQKKYNNFRAGWITGNEEEKMDTEITREKVLEFAGGFCTVVLKDDRVLGGILGIHKDYDMIALCIEKDSCSNPAFCLDEISTISCSKYRNIDFQHNHGVNWITEPPSKAEFKPCVNRITEPPSKAEFKPFLEADFVAAMTAADVKFEDIGCFFVSKNQWKLKGDNDLELWMPSLKCNSCFVFTEISGKVMTENDDHIVIEKSNSLFVTCQRGSAGWGVVVEAKEPVDSGTTEESPMKGAEKPGYAYTYSGMFMFPPVKRSEGCRKSGRRFKIPAPSEKDGWVEVNSYEKKWGEDFYVRGGEIGKDCSYRLTESNEMLRFNHFEGVLVAKEYYKRVLLESAKCLSWKKWERKIPIVPAPEPKRVPFEYDGEWPRKHPRVVIGK
jgi:hypothetical protein